MLNEYTVVVNMLLEQAYKIDAIDSLNLIGVYSIPYMDKNASRRLIKSLRVASDDEPIDIEPDKNANEKLKQIFNRK